MIPNTVYYEYVQNIDDENTDLSGSDSDSPYSTSNVSLSLLFGYDFYCALHCLLNFERSRNQRQGSELFFRGVGFVRWFTVAFLTNSMFIESHKILDLERSRNQRQGSEFFFRGVGL